jgi:hypothetical protein
MNSHNNGKETVKFLANFDHRVTGGRGVPATAKHFVVDSLEIHKSVKNALFQSISNLFKEKVHCP